jgi:putative DNA primase/helicase
MGFVVAARAVWTVCRDPSQPGRELLVPLKNNLGAEAKVLTYSIHPHPTLDAPVILWHTNRPPISVDEALSVPHKPRGPDAKEKNAATTWLRAALADGPLAAVAVLVDGDNQGCHSRTIQRAYHRIGGVPEKAGPHGGWRWSLPTAAPEP